MKKKIVIKSKSTYSWMHKFCILFNENKKLSDQNEIVHNV